MARPKLGRGIAAITGVSVAMLVAAIPASADDPVTATFVDKHEDGLDVSLVFEGQDEPETFPTRVSDIAIKDGATVKTYGFIPLAELKKDTQLIELPWPSDDSTAMKTMKLAKLAEDDTFKKINWVLRNSYPFVNTDKLAVSGVNNKEAIAATQAAIWQFLFGDFKLADDTNAHVSALYKYLTGDKNKGSENDAAPTLELTPATLSGKAGDKLGPVKIKTNAKELALTLPAGVTVVDKDGKALDASALKDGAEVFFQIPAGAAGQGTVEVKANNQAVRLFAGGGDESDRKIPEFKAAAVARAEVPDIQFFAFAQNVSKTANVSLTWTASETAPAPQGSNGGGLANTGASIYVPLGIGVLLLLAGGGALLFLRRRRA
jgi:TQXA domain-containing protein/LPXTG-motif cell wall-anchored protein